MVAEDNLVNQQVAMGLLKRWGCEVTVVGNGIEALEALKVSIPELILMDVQMPEMDGLEATRKIRKDPRFSSIPILALTAHVLPEERQKCKDAGMDDYVPKPFKPGELRERVEHWARERLGMGEAKESNAEGREAPVTRDAEPGAAEPEAAEEQDSSSPPVLLEEFRATMREAGIESVVDAAVEAYVGETPRRMEALEAAVEAGDWKAVEREAHGIKSGSKNLRADHFGRLLEEVEEAGREGREADIKAAFPELRTAFQQVMDFLNEQGSAPE